MAVGSSFFRKLGRLFVACSVLALFMAASNVLSVLVSGGAREQGIDNAVSQSSIIDGLNELWVGMTILCFLFYLNARRFALNKLRVSPALALLAILATTSILWSPNKLEAAKQAILLVSAFLLIYIAGQQLKFAEQNSLLRFFLFFVLVSSLLMVLFFPSYGISVGSHEGSWQGVFPHKNGLGNFSALSLCIFTGKILTRRNLINYFGCFVSLILVVMSQSKASIGVAVVVVVLFLLCGSKRISVSLTRRGRLILNILVVIGVFIPVAKYIDVLDMFEGVSFTGRDIIWKYTISKILDSPVYGYGLNQYASHFLVRTNEVLDSVGFYAFSPHNGFLDTLLSLGLLGGILVYGILRVAIDVDIYSENGYACFFFVIGFLVINIFEASLLSFNVGFMILIYLVTTNESSRRAVHRSD